MHPLLEKNLLPTKEASALTGYNPDYLARLCRSGKIVGTQIGRTWFVERESLMAFVAGQESRKAEMASDLSRVREEEYRAAQQPVAKTIRTTVSTVKQAQNVATETISKLVRTSSTIPSPFAYRQSVAVAVALFVVSGAAYASSTGIVERTVSNTVDNLVAYATNPIHTGPVTWRDTSLTTEENKVTAHPSLNAKDLATKFSYVGGARTNPYEKTTRAELSEGSVALAHERIGTARNVIKNPTSLFASFPEAYFALGDGTYKLIQSGLSAYENGIRATGSQVLTLAAHTRDSASAAPVLTDAILNSYAKNVYGYTEHAYEIPYTATVNAIAVGEILGGVASAAPQLASDSYEKAVLAYVHGTNRAAIALVGSQVTAGERILSTAAYSYQNEIALAAQAPQSVRSAATTLRTLPALATDAVLGITGKIAASLESAGAAVDTSRQQANVFAIIPGLAHEKIAHFVDAAKTFTGGVGIAGGRALAVLFGYHSPNTTGVAVIPFDATETLPLPAESQGASVEGADTNTTVAPTGKGTTIVNNYYAAPEAAPIDLTGRVAQAVFEMVKPYVTKSIEASNKNKRSGGGGSTTVVADQTDPTYNTLHVTGDAAIDGTLTVNTLVASTTDIDGTIHNTFTINSDNASSDAEDATLFFSRGTAGTDASLAWNAGTGRFEVNQPIYVSSQGSPTVPTLSVQGVLGQTADLFQVLDLSGNPVLVATASGNIGIGTSTPSEALSVSGNGIFSGDLSLGGTLTISPLAGAGNRCVYTDAFGILHAKSSDCGSASGGDDLGSHTATQNIQLSNNWISNDGGNEGIRISNTGNVGIGTTTPSEALSVAGNILTSGTSRFGGLATFLAGLIVNSETFTDLTGTGLVNVGGTLSVATSTFSGSGSLFNADLLDGLNSTYFLDRANHTGTQLASTISDFSTTARGLFSSTATGLTYTSGTGVFSLTSGYTIPLTASSTDWNTAYLNRITSATSPLSITGNAISISQASGSTNGYLSSTDFNTFNGKESPLTFTYPLQRSTNTISLAFGTTTANTWSQLQTFSSGIDVGASTFTSLLGTGLSNVAGALTVSTSSLGTSLATTFFKQGGNAFSGLATLGTTDNNVLRFITNGVERARFDTNQNFGIGTTTPTGTLTIQGGTSNQDPLAVYDYTGNLPFLLVHDTGDTEINGVLTANSLSLRSSGTIDFPQTLRIRSYGIDSIISYFPGSLHLDTGTTSYPYVAAPNVFTVGFEAGLNSNVDSVNFLGYQAGYNNTGAYNNFLGYQDGYNNTGSHVNLLGYQSGFGNTGSYVNAFGYQAGYGNAGTSANLFGFNAGYNNSSTNVNFFGESAGYSNTGSDVNGFGTNAGYSNTGNDVNLLGYLAGAGNTGSSVNAFGNNAANSNLGTGVNAFGNAAGNSNAGSEVNLFGTSAGGGNQGSYVNAFGSNAGIGNQAGDVNLFGQSAGAANTGADTNAFGNSAGYSNTGVSVNAFGNGAGTNNIGGYANIFGNGAGSSNTGSEVNLFGSAAGNSNSGANVNAFGGNAGTSNTGNYVNALGYYAGYSNTGTDANIFGNDAGSSNTGSNVNLLGTQAGQHNIGSYTNAIGTGAGYNFNNLSGAYNNFIGQETGFNGTIGDSNIFIGNRAGFNGGDANNIVLGTKVELPDIVGSQQLNIGNLLYGTGLYDGGIGQSSAYAGGKIGIGTTTPWKTLSVDGDFSLTGGFFDKNGSSGTSGYILQSTGTGTQWVATSTLGLGGSGGGSVTSVDASGGTTGLSFSGGPITNFGTLTLGGTLGVANGGTGSTTLSGILFGNGTSPVQTLTVGSGLSLIGSTLTATGGGGSGTVGAGTTGQFPYYAANGTTLTATSSIFMAANGFVGIGSTTPTEKLSVTGNALVSGNLGVGGTATIGTLTGLLKGSSGVVSAAVAGTDYQAPLAFTYPLVNTANTISLAFGTSTANTWGALQTFNSGVLADTFSLTGSFYDSIGNSGSNGAVLESVGGVTKWMATSTLGIALADTTGTLSVSRGGTGSTTLSGILLGNGTSAVQTLGLGTGLSLSGGILSVATSSFSGSGSNLNADLLDGFDSTYFLDRANHTGTQLASTISDFSTTARGLFSSTATGLTYTSGTGVFSLTSGYTIPLTASSTDWNTAYLNRITSAASPLSISSNVISIADAAADGTTKGAATFTASDFDAASGVISLDYTNGQKASGSVPGFLSSADFSTFNGKQAAGNYITALTGDGTASGPGSAAFTLATVNGNTGSFGSSTAIPTFTVNGKGLITAAGTAAVVAPAGTLTGATLASNVLASSLTSVGTLSSLTVSGLSDLGNASSTALTLSGQLFDGTGSSGTSGYVLQSTGTGVTWVATSTLGITGGGGSGSPGGASTNIQYNSAGSFAGSNSFVFTGTNVGIGTSSPDSILSVASSGAETGLHIDGNVNGFFQANIQNRNSGANASTDWVATANNGSNTTHYINMGINGSAGGGAPFTAANAAYLYSQDDSLSIGALGTGNTIKFYTTGGASPVERMTIGADGNVGIGTTTALSLLDVSATDTDTTLTTISNAAVSIVNRNTTANNFSDLAFTTVDSAGSNINGAKISGVFASHTAGAVLTDLAFSTMNAGTLAERLRITGQGGVVLTSASSTALTVGPNGSTNPVLTIDGSTASSVSGVRIVGAATGVTPTIIATDSGTNVGITLSSKGTGTLILTSPGASGGLNFGIGGSSKFLSSNQTTTLANQTFGFTTTALATNVTPRFAFTGSADSSLTASTEAIAINFNVSQTRTHANGALATQRDFIIQGTNHAFTSGSNTLTDHAILDIVPSTGSSANGTITNTSGIRVEGVALTGTKTNSYGIHVTASTGATNNYAATFLSGNVGIGTAAPSAQLHSTGTVRFANFGAGTLQTDASGNLSVSSDERLKDVSGGFSRGLSDLKKLSPILYRWNTLSGLDQSTVNAGFSAQNVQSAIPEAVDTDPRGFLTLSDRPILAAAVNAIKELAGTSESFGTTTSSLAARLTQVEDTIAVPETIPAEFTATRINADTVSIADTVTTGTVVAGSFIAPARTDSYTIGSTTLDIEAPSETLTTGGSVDLYKLSTYSLARVRALASRVDLLETSIEDIDTRLSLLEEAGATASSSDPISVTGTAVKNALASFGIMIQNGLARFETIAFKQLAVTAETDGTSSVASVVVPAGESEFQVENSFVLPTSKIFITFTSSVDGPWYISTKEEGSFTVAFGSPQSSDVSFDYFLIQTEGQIASPSGANPPQPPPSNNPPENNGGGGEAPPSEGDTTPPEVTLNGEAAIDLAQGAGWNDPGATASDGVDGDVSASIEVTGSVDTGTEGLYTVTYAAHDAAGNYGQVSRVVTVHGVPALEEPPAEPAP